MKAKVGLWIDHRKAIVVAVTDNGEETGLVISAIEKQTRRSQSSRHTGPYEPQQVPETIVDRKPLPDILTSTTMRSSRAFVMRNPF